MYVLFVLCRATLRQFYTSVERSLSLYPMSHYKFVDTGSKGKNEALGSYGVENKVSQIQSEPGTLTAIIPHHITLT